MKEYGAQPSRKFTNVSLDNGDLRLLTPLQLSLYSPRLSLSRPLSPHLGFEEAESVSAPHMPFSPQVPRIPRFVRFSSAGKTVNVQRVRTALRKNRFSHHEYDPNLNNYYFEGVYEPNTAYPPADEHQEIVEYILTKGKHAATFRRGQEPPKFVITSIRDSVRPDPNGLRPQRRRGFKIIPEYSSKGIFNRFAQNMKRSDLHIDFEKVRGIRDSVQRGLKKYMPSVNNTIAM